MQNFAPGVDALVDFASIIARTITEEPPINIKDGGVIREGVHGELDYYRNLLVNGEEWLREFEEQQKELTGIKNLRVNYNRNFGFFIEVTKSNLAQVPMHYIRKQTLTNVERFITEELRKHENDVFSAQYKSIELEQKIYSDLVEYAKAYVDSIEICEALTKRGKP